jgi:C-type mannose receptor
MFFNLRPVFTDSWADDEKYECDVGWQAFQAGCYKLVAEKTNWDMAQRTCQKKEANLVSVHTLPELEFITNNMKKGHSPSELYSPLRLEGTLY